MSHSEFTVATPRHACFVDITDEVARAVAESGLRDGLVHVFIPHTPG